MQLKNNTCQKFGRQINNEIAAGQQFDYLQVETLKQQTSPLKPNVYSVFRVIFRLPITISLSPQWMSSASFDLSTY